MKRIRSATRFFAPVASPLIVAGLVAATLVLPASEARAAEPEQPEWMTKPNERRAGLVIGLGAGLGLAGATGYPNKASQIGDPAYYAASGLGVGSGGTIFLMGALTDYLSFGFWAGGSSAANKDWKTSAGGGGFRLEVFPLYGLAARAPALRDLGITAQLGLGSTKIEALRGYYAGAEGVQSYLGLGAFYEWKLARIFSGHLAAGPSVDYAAVISRSVDRHELSVGGRIVLYTAL